MPGRGNAVEFADVLAAQPPALLRTIVAKRRLVFGKLVSDRLALARSLAGVLSRPESYAGVEPQLDRAEAQLLQALAAAGTREVQFDQMVAAFPAGMLPADVENVAGRLASLGLLLPLVSGRFYVPPAVTQAFQPEFRGLRQRLELLTVEHLKAMARHMHCSVPLVIRKAALVDLLYGTLIDRVAVGRIVEGLDADARTVFDVLLASAASMSLKQLRRKLPARLSDELATYYGWQGYDDGYGRPNAAGMLQRVGMVYVDYALYGSSPLLVIPDEIRNALRPETATARWYLQPAVLSAPAGTIFSAHSALLPDLVRALVFLEQERPQELKSGGFPKPMLRKLSQRVSAAGNDYPAFLIAMLLDLGLAMPCAGHFLPSESADDWFEQDRLEQMRSVAYAWRSSASWDETRPDGLQPGGQAGLLVALRDVMPSICSSLPGAVTIASLRELIEFLRPSVVGGIREVAEWPLVFGRILNSLRWLGIADLSVEGEPAVQAGWMLPALWAERDSPASETASGFVIQPNREIVAPPDLRATVLRQLLRMADGAAVSGAIVLQLSTASIRRALECGMTAEDMLAVLSRHATKGVPQTVAQLISDTAEQYGQVEVGPAEAYVKAARPELLQQVLAVGSLRGLLRPLTDTVALVSRADQAKVAAALSAAGHLPRIVDAVSRKAPSPPSYGKPASEPVEPDWDAIGLEAGPEGGDAILSRESPGSREDAQGDSSELVESLQRGDTIEIRYRNAKGGLSTRVIEPLELDFTASQVRAYCRTARAEVTFTLANILWWRLANAAYA